MYSCVIRVRDDIDERNTIQTYHLLKVNKAPVVAIDVVLGYREVRPVRVGLQDTAPCRRGRLRRGDVEEERLGAGFEDRVCL